MEMLVPENEVGRIAALRSYNVLDTAPEKAFDDITLLAARTCGVSMSAVSLVDTDRQWLKSKVGMALCQTERSVAFCARAILTTEPLVVPDARHDSRFANNPLVTGEPYLRFYAGFPLMNPQGFALGSLCVLDVQPRELGPGEIETMRALANQVVTQLELRRSVAALEARVAEHEACKAALAASERFAHGAVDALTSQIAILDERGVIVAVNDAWRRFAEANGGGATRCGVGANYLEVCERAAGRNARGAASVAMAITDVMHGRREVFSMEYPCHSPQEKRWFVARVTAFGGAGPTKVVVAHENVTARKRAELRLRHQSTHDPLTDLPNRHLFTDRVERRLTNGGTGTKHFAVLFIDLDRFKVINDSLGHGVGDKLLLRIAETLRSSLRASDVVCGPMGPGLVARLGGDEFTLLLDNLSRPADAERVAARLLEDLSVPQMIDGHEVFTTASIGIAHSDPRYTRPEEMIRDADAAMYHAKAAGKARYAVFDAAMHEAVASALQLETDLRRAVERNELTLAYQPVVSLVSNQVVGFEALARWRHPTKGDISPAKFIPLAEESGLILPLGRWAIETACRQLAAWRRAGPARGRVTVNVNLSRRQLGDPGLIGHLEQVLAETGIDPSCLNLEITETAVIDNASASHVLEKLKNLRVRLYVDDFGMGQSSLGCLHRFPLDGIKIDRSFVAGAAGCRSHAAVIHSVIDLAKNLGIGVVAEGLETPEQVAMLQGLDCDYGQGYYFAKPLTAQEAGTYWQRSLGLGEPERGGHLLLPV